MSVESLSQVQCWEAVSQMATSRRFRENNMHLSELENAALLEAPPRWPNKPVFSPYAPTHDGYSQIMFQSQC